MSLKIKCYVEEREEVYFKNREQEKKEEEWWKEVSQLWLKSQKRWKCNVNFNF